MDPEIPRLSPSIAHELLSESPLHAWTIHRLLGGMPKPVTDAQERGSAIHAFVFQAGSGVVLVPHDDFRSKAAKEARDAARENGEIPLAGPKYEELRSASERIRSEIERLGYDLSTGHAELRMEWSESSEFGDVDCSGRIDWIRNDRQLILDLKTREGSCHPNLCASLLVKSPGHLQEAAYKRAAAYGNPDLIGRIRMVFLFAQTVEPFSVVPIECAGSMQELGEVRWARAVDTWGACLRKGREREHWPSYADAPVRVEAPVWALQQEMLLEETT